MLSVWSSSDSRTPRRRPSIAGRMPIFGQLPTKRDLGWASLATLDFGSRVVIVRSLGPRRCLRGIWPGAGRRRVGSARWDDTDGEQQVGIDPYLAGRDGNGEV